MDSAKYENFQGVFLNTHTILDSIVQQKRLVMELNHLNEYFSKT